jgi:hypothetical protein
MNRISSGALSVLLSLSILAGIALLVSPVHSNLTLDSPVKDAEISSLMDANVGQADYLTIGFNNYTNEVYRFLVQFELPAELSAEDIASAYLSLCVPTPWSNGYPSGEIIRVCRVTHDWIEGTGDPDIQRTYDGVTWNEYNYYDGIATSANNWALPGGDYSLEDSSTGTLPTYSPGVPLSFTNITVTEIVKDWVSGAYPNFGLILKLEDETGTYRGGVFNSKERDPYPAPALEIIYASTIPTENPTDTPSTNPSWGTPTPAPSYTSIAPSSSFSATPNVSDQPSQAPSATINANGGQSSLMEYVVLIVIIVLVLVSVAVLIRLRKRAGRDLPPPPPP